MAEGSLGLVRAVRATYFFARITAFFTGDAVGCQKTVMLFSLIVLVYIYIYIYIIYNTMMVF